MGTFHDFPLIVFYKLCITIITYYQRIVNNNIKKSYFALVLMLVFGKYILHFKLSFDTISCANLNIGFGEFYDRRL